MNWFKFYGLEWLNDPKIISLGVEDRLCFITLLCLASSSKEPGVVENIDEDLLRTVAHLPQWITEDTDPYRNAEGVLKRLQDLKMVRYESNIRRVTVINYLLRQTTNLDNAERQALFRARTEERQKAKNPIKTTKNPVTKVTLDKRREDKRREDKIESTHSPGKEAFKFFEDQKEQESVIGYLMEKGVNQESASKEIRKFISYWTELNKSGTKQRWQLQKTFEVKRRLATWFSNIKNFQRSDNSPKVIKI